MYNGNSPHDLVNKYAVSINATVDIIAQSSTTDGPFLCRMVLKYHGDILPPFATNIPLIRSSTDGVVVSSLGQGRKKQDARQNAAVELMKVLKIEFPSLVESPHLG